MSKQQAIDLVLRTFESPFDKQQFVVFIKDLLNYIEEAPFIRQGNYIPDQFSPYVSRFERIGKYFSGKQRIDILIVNLKKETSIERARSMQRNFVAGYLQGKYGTDSIKDAALVAFVSPDSDDWRFSLVKMEYKLEETPKGAMKAKEEYTPAKRWSFLVGKHEKSHTAQSRLVPIIADDEHNPTLAELEEAFNIEKVTKEYFEKYRGLFIWTKEELDKVIHFNQRTKADFESKSINTVDFAKKLLGQIVFLYYLQKKGWFGVPRDADWGEGSKNFLRELFQKKHGGYQNFFNDILEPLFYEALRMDRSYDDHYYSRFNCKIPFLNGGLFDPMNNYDWVKTDILVANELFSNSNITKEGDTGNGILDIFDRYNFTVKEDEPFEKEVAIDPELLGKTYEKFNAIRPDNYEEYLKALRGDKKGEENKFNKQYGVYYTPREIVHYMCQQSLINYLATELDGKASKQDVEILVLRGEQIKENDARVVAEGRETKDYSYLMPETIRKNAPLIDEKLASIKVCDPAVGSGAFPVGMMSEIVKTRHVLETFTKADKTIYDFKRKCIENSLYGVDIDSGAVEIAKLRLWLSLVVDEEDPQSIKPLPNLDYKIICGNSLVGLPDGILLPPEVILKLEERKKEYFYVTNPTTKLVLHDEINNLFYQLVESAKQFDPTLTDVNFDFQTHFSEVFHSSGGFDVTIGNPPYVRADSGDDYLRFRRVIEKSGRYETLWEKWDLFIPFIELAYKLLKNNGVTTMIVSDAYCHAKYAQKSQTWFLKNSRILRLDFLNRLELFEAGVKNITYLYQRAVGNNNIPERRLHDPEFGKIINLPSDVQENLNHRAFFPEDTKSELSSKPTLRLDEICYISVGMVVHADEKVAKGAFQLEDLISDVKDKTHPKPFVEGKDLNKWVLDKPKYLEWGTNRAPSLFRRKTFMELYEQDEKIMLPMVGDIRAGLDHCRLYCNHGIFVGILWHKLSGVKNKSLKKSAKYFSEKSINQYSPSRELYEKNSQRFSSYFLLGVLNSAYARNFLKANRRNNIQLYPNDWKALPIPDVGLEEQKPIVKLVERILEEKHANPNADISKLEVEIDQLVSQLYGLT